MNTHLYSKVRRFAVALVLGCLALRLSSTAQAAEDWKDITSPLLARLTNNGAKAEWPGGCSGVVVNRTNGDVTIKVVGFGLWRSSDQGEHWNRIDGNVISGRDETAWATSVEQNAPGRMASFSLDGAAGWTVDGSHWKKFTTLGRNWDFGSVDWASELPQTIVAAKHETTPPGEVYASQDGGSTWKQLPIYVNSNRDKISMVGVMNPSTFVYSKGDGIQRSRDGGLTWTKVASANPQTRIPVLFRGAHYLGDTNGLLVSKDLGATWKQQGAPVNIWQGPFFGRDQNEMLVVGKEGVFVSQDAGETWKLVAALKKKEAGFLFIPNWFGCYSWDPVHNVLYVSAMGNPVYKLVL
jgi:photosystem II stability/assembly factor-like uncharacterized protein